MVGNEKGIIFFLTLGHRIEEHMCTEQYEVFSAEVFWH